MRKGLIELIPRLSSGAARGPFPALCLILSFIMISALAGFSGGGVIIYSDDIFPAHPPENDAAVPVGGDAGAGNAVREAESISARFGIEIAFGDRVPRSLGAYPLEPATDEALVLKALAAVRDTLSFFPEGMFRKLAELGPGGIELVLCGGIEWSYPVSGLTGFSDGKRMIALSVNAEYGRLRATLAHELCHAADMTLDRLAAEDPSHWSGDGWLALCPPGFSYYSAYSDADGKPYAEYGDPSFTVEDAKNGIWFINRSSKISPYEDRAETVEALFLLGSESPIIKSPHIAAKLTYYLEALRYYLGVDIKKGWLEAIPCSFICRPDHTMP
ncbi:MAG: hypothetical protein J5854_02115 [Clostridia bacterium]|nr:hypothetical protein [Clostridia bacterium]